MGRVRSTYIKRAARKLLERYPDKFSTDFKKNCLVLDELVTLNSKSLRNRIAGYLSTLLKQKKEV
ncbi:MAG: 30S ribosomal protein S17e [Hadesarchaea archaeon]|nr:30S ribosomal protein S17e [Hadesarchaea archaeon]